MDNGRDRKVKALARIDHEDMVDPAIWEHARKYLESLPTVDLVEPDIEPLI